MFFVRPTEQRANEPRNACSKCASPHSAGQNFCTKCGWDLSHEFTPDTTDTVLASEMRQSQAATTATLERPSETAASEPVTANGFAPEQSPVPSSEEEPVPEPGAQVVAEEAGVGETAAQSPGASNGEDVNEPEPEPADRPWGIPIPGPAPTAEVMTARGAALFSEGKLQEAIDQFTKAIALDPRHREAFEGRAEAYSKQGRQDRADEDYQKIQALIAGT